MSTVVVDCLNIEAGPAGLTAVTYLARFHPARRFGKRRKESGSLHSGQSELLRLSDRSFRHGRARADD